MKVPNRRLLEDEYQNQRPVMESILEVIESRFHDWFRKEDYHFGIKVRLKSFRSFFEKYIKKFRHNGEAPSILIQDLLGIRIICPFLEDLKKAETLIRREFIILEEERKGAQQNVREFGYESLHFLVDLPLDLKRISQVAYPPPLEIQVRTIIQDAWAEVEHELIYKAKFAPFDQPLKRKLAALNANLTLSDIIFQEIRDYQRQLSHELNLRRKTFLSHVRSVQEPDQGFSPSLHTHEDLSPANETSSIDQLLLEALSSHNANNYKKAINYYSTILRKDASGFVKSLVLVHRGMAYFAEGLFENALDDFDNSMKEDPQNSKAFYYRGVVKDFLGHYKEAIKDFDQSLILVPVQYDSLIARAKAHEKLGQIFEARDDCQAALNIHPEAEDALALARQMEIHEFS